MMKHTHEPPNLVDFIDNSPYDADLFPKMKDFLKHEIDSDDRLLFQKEPVRFKEAIFGKDRTFEAKNKGKKRSDLPKICWICVKKIEKGTEKFKQLSPVLLTIIYTAFFLTVPSLPKPSWKKKQHEFENDNYIVGMYCHPCCDLGKKEFDWITFNGAHFLADDNKIRKGLKSIQGRRNCDTITSSNLDTRSKYVSIAVNNACEYIQNEIVYLSVYYTPTDQHLKLWTLYVYYILCLLQLKSKSTKKSVEPSTVMAGFGRKKLVKKMKSIKIRIFELKESLEKSRIYGKNNILNFCNYHFQEYCRDNIIELSEKEKQNVSKFFEVSLNIKHIEESQGEVLFTDSFADVFGWSYGFIYKLVVFLDQRSLNDFYLFLVEFHKMYRAYGSFWEHFFVYYRDDFLYLKFKENIHHFFQLDLKPFEEGLPLHIKKMNLKDENTYIPFLPEMQDFYDSLSNTLRQDETFPIQRSESTLPHDETTPMSTESTLQRDVQRSKSKNKLKSKSNSIARTSGNPFKHT